MGQLNAYLDQDILNRVIIAAKIENKSVSGWVRDQLLIALENRQKWPENYEKLFGTLSDVDIQIPEDHIPINDLVEF